MNVINYMCYNATTGKIFSSGQCVESDLSLQAKEGLTVIKTDTLVNDARYYVSDGTITEKAEISATWSAETVTADGSSEIVLSTLPTPCIVYIDGEAVSVEDGSLEFSTSAVGYYHIRIDEPAFLEKEWVINAI